MERSIAGPHLQAFGLLSLRKNRADYRLGCSFLPQCEYKVLRVSELERAVQPGLGANSGEDFNPVSISSELGHLAMPIILCLMNKLCRARFLDRNERIKRSSIRCSGEVIKMIVPRYQSFSQRDLILEK